MHAPFSGHPYNRFVIRSYRLAEIVVRSRKTIAVGILSLIFVGTVVYLVDLGDVISALGRLSTATVAIAAALVVLANLFALARSGTVLGALGFRAPWQRLFLAFSASNISNLPLNIIGQSVTRAMLLANSGIPFSVTVTATYIERILAAGLLFLFSLIGHWFLFGRIAFELDRGGGDILSTIGGIGIVCAAVGLTVFRRQLVNLGKLCIGWLSRLWASAALSILCHGAGLVAYLVLLDDLAAPEMSMGLVAALIIIMFVSSLPISFAGWGLRELSAAGTLSLIGISSNVAVAVAIAIGLLYLAVTGLFAIAGILLLAGKRRDATAAQPKQDLGTIQIGAAIGRNWDNHTVQGCAILCAILLFFRVPIQLLSSDIPINVNVADVIVFVALSVILLMIAAGRIRSLFPPFLTTTLAGLSAVIMIGLINSYAQNNLGNWALYTRGLGWILMLGYTALGAAMVSIAGNAGRILILRSMVVVAITICVLQLVVLAWSALVIPIPRYVLAYPLEGFANNQNAFSFELAMTGVLLIVGRNLNLFDGRQWFFTVAVAVLTLTIYFTGSRTGAVFIVILALLDHFFARKLAGNWANLKPRVSLIAATTIVAVLLLPYAMYFAALALRSVFGIEIDADALFAGLAQPDATGNTRLLHPTSDIERWDTITGGLSLWVDRPIWGAGTGAYVEWARASGLKAQGIHSVYIWFMAEMGVAGLAMVTDWACTLPSRRGA